MCIGMALKREGVSFFLLREKGIRRRIIASSTPLIKKELTEEYSPIG